MAAESLESPLDGGPAHTKEFRASTKADLGAEQARDRRVEPRFAQAVVDAKGLRTEAAAAIQAPETRHSSSVASPLVGTMATPALRAEFDAAGAGLVWAAGRLESHRRD